MSERGRGRQSGEQHAYACSDCYPCTHTHHQPPPPRSPATQDRPFHRALLTPSSHSAQPCLQTYAPESSTPLPKHTPFTQTCSQPCSQAESPEGRGQPCLKGKGARGRALRKRDHHRGGAVQRHAARGTDATVLSCPSSHPELDSCPTVGTDVGMWLSGCLLQGGEDAWREKLLMVTPLPSSPCTSRELGWVC